MKKYKIYCETDGRWEHTIGNVAPTVCPTNAAHTVNLSSVCITDKDVTEDDGVSITPILNDYKKLKFNAIDKRTGELIAQGFQFDNGNGVKTFSLSNNAQINLLGVNIKRNDGILPLTFHTIDDMDEETFTTPETLDAFFMTALASKKAHLDSGSALKVQVRNAVDKNAVDLVIDSRS